VKSSFTNERILVSAIIPTYNRGYIVGKAIDSILNQTYDNIEVIVVDDGSTDNTLEKLKEYGDRIRVVSQTNSGPAAARNHGIAVSRGEIIAFLDSDDIWLPTKIERQVSLLESVPNSVPCCLCNGITTTPGAKWSAFDMGLFYPDCEEGLWLNVTEVLATRFILFCQLVAIRRDALERAGYFDPSLRFMEDYDLALRLSLEGPWGFIQEPLAAMNLIPEDSLTLKVLKEQVCHAEYTLKTREHVFATLQSKDKNATGLAYLNQAIKRARRELWGARLRESNRRGVQVVGNFFKRLERYRMAIYRRSPSFPKVKTARIERRINIPIADVAEAELQTEYF
jgi:glycosyltransferase involved in cell wall biosynthesis